MNMPSEADLVYLRGDGKSGKNFFFSQGLDIKQPGKLTDFHVNTSKQVATQSQRL